jgi:hypothetical protein
VDQQQRPVEQARARLDAQVHRRFIKTHLPLDGLPFDERVTYLGIGRDPRDVALSWAHHVLNFDPDWVQARFAEARAAGQLPGIGPDDPLPTQPTDPRVLFWAWMEIPPQQPAATSLHVTINHLNGLWQARQRPNVILLHYAEFTADLAGNMRALAARLGIDVPEHLWPSLVSAAGLPRMRQRADLLAPGARDGQLRSAAGFFHAGTSGQWREFLSTAEQQRYRDVVTELAAPELLAWLHQDDFMVPCQD